METRRQRGQDRRGFTMVELSVAMVISSVMFVAVMNVLASNHKNFNQTYERVYGDVVTDAYISRLVFDEVVRQSTIRKAVVGITTGNEYYVEVYYYSLATVGTLDRYAQFCVPIAGGNLVVRRGRLIAGTFTHTGTETTQVLAHHVVVSPTINPFSYSGPTVSMALTLNDGKVDMPVLVTATRHNE